VHSRPLRFGNVAAGGLFGLAQGALVELLKLPSIVITLATFSGIQGVSLLLRPQPGGMITDRLSDTIGMLIFGVPLGMILAVAAMIGLEFILSRRSFGRSWRATGSDQRASHVLGINARRVRLVAFALAGLLTGCGGLVLAGQVGIGSAATGVNYTLLSITAAVLSGVKISGGRASFIAVLAGALMVQTIMSATPFFQISDAWQYWLVGAATLVAASLFSMTRNAAKSRGT
jgi:ribose transport system ATP-binding protein